MRNDIERHEFEQLEEAHRQILTRLDQLGAQMTDVQREIGGAPRSDYRGENRQTLRARMHNLETRIAADELAKATLDHAVRERHEAEDIRGRTWSTRRIVLAWFLGSVVAVLTIVQALFAIFGVQ